MTIDLDCKISEELESAKCYIDIYNDTGDKDFLRIANDELNHAKKFIDIAITNNFIVSEYSEEHRALKKEIEAEPDDEIKEELETAQKWLSYYQTSRDKTFLQMSSEELGHAKNLIRMSKEKGLPVDKYEAQAQEMTMKLRSMK